MQEQDEKKLDDLGKFLVELAKRLKAKEEMKVSA